ncbi:hypothetical protein [Enhygromyxa salina]|uniref:hypothetical protein n=1 Tax=Enhygromyxa salina TaxID=215803 RepID=UPI0011B25A2F|nr:hypothetical protein [Enhygromyxa salina]
MAVTPKPEIPPPSPSPELPEPPPELPEPPLPEVQPPPPEPAPQPAPPEIPPPSSREPGGAPALSVAAARRSKTLRAASQTDEIFAGATCASFCLH